MAKHPAKFWLLILGLQATAKAMPTTTGLSPELLQLGKNMYMPELLSELSSIASKVPVGAHRLPSCDEKSEALVTQCGLKDLLMVFFPAAEVFNITGKWPQNDHNIIYNQSTSRRSVKLSPEDDIRELCSYYDEFARCVADFGIPQTCAPKYLSTVQVLVGYSCGTGRDALTKSLECIATKMKGSAMTLLISELPGCDNAVPTNLLLRSEEAWLDYLIAYGNQTMVQIQAVMAMVCTQWSIYSHCYSPAYALRCGDITRSYFDGLNAAVHESVKTSLANMGTKYEHLSTCGKGDIKSAYELSQVFYFTLKPFIHNFVRDLKFAVDEFEKEKGICSPTAVLARMSYCIGLGGEYLPAPPSYLEGKSFAELMTWICKGMFDFGATCWVDYGIRGCESAKKLQMDTLLQSACQFESMIKSDPHFYCFDQSLIFSDPRMQVFKACNITIDDALAFLIHVLTSPHQTLCDGLFDTYQRFLESTACVLVRIEELFNIFPLHCAQNTIDLYNRAASSYQEFVRQHLHLAQQVVKDNCPK